MSLYDITRVITCPFFFSKTIELVLLAHLLRPLSFRVAVRGSALAPGWGRGWQLGRIWLLDGVRLLRRLMEEVFLLLIRYWWWWCGGRCGWAGHYRYPTAKEKTVPAKDTA